MINAIIEGNTATLELRVKIPKHYYEFFKYLEEIHGFDSNRLAKMAADGIIMDANTMQEALHEAFNEADAKSSRNFRYVPRASRKLMSL